MDPSQDGIQVPFPEPDTPNQPVVRSAAAEPDLVLPARVNFHGISRAGLKIAEVFSVRSHWSRSLGMVSFCVPLL